MNNHCEVENSGHNPVHCDADKIPGWNKDLELAFSAYKKVPTLPEELHQGIKRSARFSFRELPYRRESPVHFRKLGSSRL